MMNSFRERVEGNLDSLISDVESDFKSSSEGLITIGNYLLKGSGHSQDMSIHELSLDDLCYLPRPLCDTILVPEASLVTYDHYKYWAWTTACAAKYFESYEDNPIPSDFFTMIHLILFPIRQRLLDQRVSGFIESVNPSVRGIESGFVIRFAGTNGFSILEGMTHHRCEEINEDGKLRKGYGPIQLPHNKLTDDDNIYFLDGLWLWKRNTSGTVEQTLKEINDLGREILDIERINEVFIGPPDEWTEDMDFLWGIKEQRNYNVHGKGSTQLVGVILLNLCCLMIWDHISTEVDDFEDEKDEILEEVNESPMFSMSGQHPNWPSAYYPLLK